MSFPIPAVLCQTWGFYEPFWVLWNSVPCVWLYNLSCCNACLNVSAYCTIPDSISSREPPSHLLPSVVNSVPLYPHYSRVVLASTTLAIHVTATCLLTSNGVRWSLLDWSFLSASLACMFTNCPIPLLLVGSGGHLRNGLPASEKSYRNESWSPPISLRRNDELIVKTTVLNCCSPLAVSPDK